MLIVSQDKMKTTENIELWIEELWENTQFERKLFYIKNQTGTLGAYETKKRAREVLQEIINAYSDFNYYKSTVDKEKQKKIGLKIYERYRNLEIYKMPEE